MDGMIGGCRVRWRRPEHSSPYIMYTDKQHQKKLPFGKIPNFWCAVIGTLMVEILSETNFQVFKVVKSIFHMKTDLN